MNTTAGPPPTEPESTGQPRPARSCVPPFDPRRLRRQMLLDAAIRWTAGMGLGVCLLAVLALEWSSLWMAGLLMLAAVIIWMRLSAVSAKVWQGLHRLTPLLVSDPDQAEAWLAEHLRRLPLHRPVRLLLYHRLAMLRHRQQRFAEAGAICQQLLSQRLGPAERVRSHLLLLLVEASLAVNNPWGAYLGLVGLHSTRLSLVESLQCMALRTRYELAVGQYGLALADLSSKIERAELMPAPQCGAVHAMFAAAAARSRHDALADWLQRRAELICGPEQLEELARSGGFLDIPEVSGSA